jgi:hypothetical protein
VNNPLPKDQNAPSALRYQRDRGLDEVPSYATGAQLVLPDNTRVYLAVSHVEFAIYFENSTALHFDLEGRLTKVVESTQYFRHSLSHRVLHTTKHTAEEGGGVSREVLPGSAADDLVSQANHAARVILDAITHGTATIELGRPSSSEALPAILPRLQLAAGFDVPVAHHDAERFHKIYGRVAILPPDQYNALVLQATTGCAYCGCLFCSLYQGITYARKTTQQFREHMDAAIAYHGDGLRARRSIFLGEANALSIPQPALKEIFQTLNERFEFPPPETPTAGAAASWWLGQARRFDGVSSFLDAFSKPYKTPADYWQLRQLGLRRVYVGLETGDAALLKWLRKPATPESTAKVIHALKEASLAVGVIVLLGAGGKPFSNAHVQYTVEMLNNLPLGRGDYIYFSPLEIQPDGPYAARAIDAHEPMTADEMRQQESAIRAGLRVDGRRGRPYLARYELETFVY